MIVSACLQGYVTVHNRQFKASDLGIALVKGAKQLM